MVGGKKQFQSSQDTYLPFFTQDMLYIAEFASFFTGSFSSQEQRRNGAHTDKRGRTCGNICGVGAMLPSQGAAHITITSTSSYFLVLGLYYMNYRTFSVLKA